MRMTPQVLQLLNGGDMACAFREWDRLARICDQMRAVVQVESVAEKARTIAGEASQRSDTARHMWAELATSLRHLD